MADAKLIAAAIAVREHAYAPYSGFKVGAALLCEGKVFAGVNVENAAYGSTICAERAAILAAVAAGCTKPQRIAIVTDVAAHQLTPPCGACCQVLAEFNPRFPIILANLAGDYKETSLDKLYTQPFTAALLEDATNEAANHLDNGAANGLDNGAANGLDNGQIGKNGQNR